MNKKVNLHTWGNKKTDFYGKDSTDEDAEYEEGLEAEEIVKKKMKGMSN
jgi:hypothetical protein